MALRLGSTVINCADLEVMTAFWSRARSRRAIPIDPTTAQHPGPITAARPTERPVAGSTWVDNDTVMASRTGTVVSPQTLGQMPFTVSWPAPACPV